MCIAEVNIAEVNVEDVFFGSSTLPHHHAPQYRLIPVGVHLQAGKRGKGKRRSMTIVA